MRALLLILFTTLSQIPAVEEGVDESDQWRGLMTLNEIRVPRGTFLYFELCDAEGGREHIWVHHPIDVDSAPLWYCDIPWPKVPNIEAPVPDASAIARFKLAMARVFVLRYAHVSPETIHRYNHLLSTKENLEVLFPLEYWMSCRFAKQAQEEGLLGETHNAIVVEYFSKYDVEL